MHLCRGNYKGRWLSEGGYEPIAERLFSELPVSAFLLEFDTARAGGFSPLRFVPSGKRAMLGLVSTKTPRLENADDLARLIDRAAGHAPLDRLGICPQCGFASTVGGNPLSVDDERRKLALVVDVARRVWS
jgi:5-methyltetrahydropteroyltriglutamate--homocysteine methyltransferase